MRTATQYGRIAGAIAIASLASACVQPAYQAPGPIQLQQYPPAVSYDSSPNYRFPPSDPIPLQAAPLVEPLPPPTATPAPVSAPAVTETTPDDQSGAIPLGDMPTPTSDRTPLAAPTASPTTDQTTPAAQPIRKAPSTAAGSNVPLEGFRPMHSQTRPAP